MLGKFGIFAVILILIFLFFIVISFGAGFFSKGKKSPEIKKYLKFKILSSLKRYIIISIKKYLKNIIDFTNLTKWTYS